MDLIIPVFPDTFGGGESLWGDTTPEEAWVPAAKLLEQRLVTSPWASVSSAGWPLETWLHAQPSPTSHTDLTAPPIPGQACWSDVHHPANREQEGFLRPGSLHHRGPGGALRGALPRDLQHRLPRGAGRGPGCGAVTPALGTAGTAGPAGAGTAPRGEAPGSWATGSSGEAWSPTSIMA